MIINTDLKELKTISDREYYERYLDNCPDDCLDETLSFIEYKRELLETDKLFINSITKENETKNQGRQKSHGRIPKKRQERGGKYVYKNNRRE